MKTIMKLCAIALVLICSFSCSEEEIEPQIENQEKITGDSKTIVGG